MTVISVVYVVIYWVDLLAMIYQVGIIVLQYSAVWSMKFGRPVFIYSAVWYRPPVATGVLQFLSQTGSLRSLHPLAIDLNHRNIEGVRINSK